MKLWEKVAQCCVSTEQIGKEESRKKWIGEVTSTLLEGLGVISN